MLKFDHQNLNHLWSQLIIEELIRNGVHQFCIAPGSRSTPLTLSVAKNKKSEVEIHYDERGLGFFGLGYGAATQMPACIITTSGSAVANLWPAVVEATKKKIPLLLLTADRPHELRYTGANQTIDQVKIFGEYTKWFYDMPEPTQDIDPSFLLTTIDQAVWQARENRGVVHINCPFREPLAPVKNDTISNNYLRKISQWSSKSTPYTSYELSNTILNKQSAKEVANLLNSSKNGLIAVGKLASSEDQNSVIKLAEKLNWPIFPDITSGLRTSNNSKQGIHYFDIMLSDSSIHKDLTVDTVLQVGGRITSKRYNQVIEQINPKNYIMVLKHPLRNDPSHNVTMRIQSQAASFCHSVVPLIKSKKTNKLLTRLNKSNSSINRKIDIFFKLQSELSEPEVSRLISRNIHKSHALFLANSLSIREMDTFAATDGPNIPLSSNRGASGIDGTIASACGFSKGLNKRTTLLIGDLAFLHDINSLSLVRELVNPMTIVVLNNNGGGIFNFLPISKEEEHFDRYFSTPHNLKFKEAARMFGLSYHVPKSVHDFKKDYLSSLTSESSSLIEIKSNKEFNVKMHNDILKAVTG